MEFFAPHIKPLVRPIEVLARQMSSLAPSERQHRQGEEQLLLGEPQLFCSEEQPLQSEEQLLSGEPQLFCSEEPQRSGEGYYWFMMGLSS